MKKTLVSLLFAIGLLFAVNTETRAQNALLVQGGWSWSEGVAAVGYQFGTLSTSIGYMPAKMPGSGDWVSGVVWNVKWGPKWDESGYYASYAYNTVGYRSQNSYNGGSWTDNYVEGMHILSLGYKVGSWDGMYLAADVGYGWCGSGSGASYGVVLGWAFGN
jgi:hypothetical protein